MADASHEPDRFDPGHEAGGSRAPNGRAAPQDWSNAFAALPTQAPPRDLWPALAARLPAPRPSPQRARPWPYGMALAAGLSLVAFGAIQLLSRLEPAQTAGAIASDPEAPTTVAPQGVRPQDRPSETLSSQAAGRDTAGPASRATAAPVVDAAVGGTATAAQAAPVQTPPAGDVRIVEAAPRVAAALPERPTQRPQRHGPKRPLRRVPASGPTLPVERRLARTDAIDTATPQQVAAAATAPTLTTLYAESAQWEDLLHLTRDPRVGSGPAALLAGEFDAALARIDAALAAPQLDDATQTRLWQARVDTLREAVRFEAGVRTLASEGRSYEGALVNVD